ncbi:MAG TPA: biosynthetic-type acetolactate synthase large subunit [Chitinophagaceae bacterium]|nr:biosynthetic-type acetolactate synthase large subunit [Chitinophagaceae bacterium]
MPQKDALLTKTESVQQPEQKITGAEALIICLLEEGVETIFGYPGGAIMPIYDALYHYADKVTHILTRHEQGAIHAAQGYARVSGRPGVVFATSGPGATNLVTGLGDAMIDSTPLVCITGQVASHLLGTDAFQETDVMNITIPVTKWNVQITRSEEIPQAMAKAFYIARTGRPGPVLVDITKDAQFGNLQFHYEPCTYIRTYNPVPVLNPGDIELAVDLINQANKPFILAGQGILLSGATAELTAFAEKSGIPVASTLLGLSGFPTDHPLYAGYLGMHGNYGPNKNINQCDLVIAIGMRFDDRVTGDLSKYARQAKIIHIDIDLSEINKNIPADIAIHADAKEALKALIERIEPKQHDHWVDSFHQLRQQEYEKIVAGDWFPVSGQIKMGEVIRHLSELTGGHAVIVTDVGQHQMVTSRYFTYKTPRTNVTSGGLGTMGFALPAAMGARLGEKDLPVIAIIGDGGFQMTLQELGTIFQYNIAVKIVVLNNNFLGMVRQWQQLFFESRYSFTEMVNPDFVKLVQAYGIPAVEVTRREELSHVLSTMLAHNGPYFVDVKVEKEENVFPMVPSGAGVSDMILEVKK